MVAEQRRALRRSVRAEPEHRDAAARVPARALRRPLARRRDPRAHQPARRRARACARCSASASAGCRTSCPASRWPSARPRSSRRTRACEGLVLEKHGLFTFGDDAKTSYERHIELVGIARTRTSTSADGGPPPARRAPGRRDARVARDRVGGARGAGACARGDLDRPCRRFVLEHRSSDEILHFAAAEQGPALAASRADHARPRDPHQGSRICSWSARRTGTSTRSRAQLREEIDTYRVALREVLRAQRRGEGRDAHHARPDAARARAAGHRPGGGGRDARAPRASPPTSPSTPCARRSGPARSAATRASPRATCSTWSTGASSRRSSARGEAPPLAGQVALVTGGAGAIGEGVARELAARGRERACWSTRTRRGSTPCARGSRASAARSCCADVTDEGDVRDAFLRAAALFGGVDSWS